MARPAFGSRTTCKSCNSVDVRRRHREGRVRARQSFSCSWTYGGEPSGTIHVRAEYDAVLLIYRARSWGATEWKSIEQRVRITWTACHLGGRRPWFVCSVCSNGRYCGRRVAVSTVLANYSRADAATGWLTRASKNRWTTAELEGRRTSA